MTKGHVSLIDTVSIVTLPLYPNEGTGIFTSREVCLLSLTYATSWYVIGLTSYALNLFVQGNSTIMERSAGKIKSSARLA